MAIEQIPSPQGQITGSVLFYSRPEPLSPENHGTLGLKPMDAPFAFAANAHVIPLQVSEFGPASLSYPIIFAGEQRAPMAVLGVMAGDNVFVDANGQYDPNAYIPAFVRRYPFVLANNDQQEQLVVCIDRAAPMLVEGGQVPLFENGKLSPFAEQAVEFCSNFETERRRSDMFVDRLKELDLFEVKQANYQPRLPDGSLGAPILVADYFAISEEKLGKLPDADLKELHLSGALRQCYAHLTSMFNWERIIGRASNRPNRIIGNA
ncbi:MAG: SapC family protein [Caulobacteraceae bacterium]